METMLKTKLKKPIFRFLLLVVLLIPTSFSSGNPKVKCTPHETSVNYVEISGMNSNMEAANNFLLTDFFIETDYDEEIFMEDWMLDMHHKFWTTSYDESIAEEEIELENWMIDLSEWKLLN